MKKGKKWIVGLLLIVSTVVAGLELYASVTAYSAPYPQGDVNGYIAWGAGGATDTTSRALTVHAGQFLGANIILQNQTGATGAIATEHVYNQKSDGYSLLFNAENPPLYKLMGISQIDYSDFYPVLLVGRQTAMVVVRPDAPYQSITGLLEDAAARPGEIKMGTTGVGGLPFNVIAMLQTTSQVEFKQVPFDGDSEVLTALVGGHVDVSIVNYSTAVDLVESGQVRMLTAMANEPMVSAPDVEAIGQVLPEYQKYFPWGAFVGVFVKDDCSDRVKELLTEAFQKAYEKEEFQTYLAENYITPMGLSGPEAREFIDQWQRVTAWLLEDAGVTELSPAELGIIRVE